MALPQLTLQSAPFQFAEFKPIEYKQQVADTNILRDSFRQIEARRKEANAMKDSVDSTVSEIRANLDSSEFEEFDKEFGNLQARIGDLINLGDSGAAIRLANTAGRNMARDPKWANKIRVKKQRDEWLDNAKKEGYDDLTIRRMKRENKYYDDGTGEFKHGEYHKALAEADFLNMLVKMTPVQQNDSTVSGSSQSYNFNIDGKLTNNPIDSSTKNFNPNANLIYKSGSSFTNRRSVTELREEDLWKTAKELLKDSTVANGLRTRFDDLQSLYKECIEIINDPNANERDKRQAQRDLQTAKAGLEDENGLINSDVNDDAAYQKWLNSRLSKLIKTAIYKHVGTTKDRTYTLDYNFGGNSSGGNGATITSNLMFDGTTQGEVINLKQNQKQNNAPTPGAKQAKSNGTNN